MPLFWLLLVILLVAAVRNVRLGDDSSKVSKSEPMPTALAILRKERYAPGEIGREEYVQKRDDLKRS